MTEEKVSKQEKTNSEVSEITAVRKTITGVCMCVCVSNQSGSKDY